jgi:DNA-binding NarL/FixJ family response regulator
MTQISGFALTRVSRALRVRPVAKDARLCDICFMAVTVVIVDDHPSFRTSARTLLELEGFEVVGEAADGASALEVAAALEPELVLLDIALPDTTGFEVAERLARGPSKVILTSSRELRDLGRRVQASGALGFVPKDRLTGAVLAELLGSST